MEVLHMPEPLINSTRVDEVFKDCLFKEGEPTNDYIPAEGITVNVGFHPQRLESYRNEVRDMLSNLPKQFFPKGEGGGDGWAFSGACNDKNDTQWTSFHVHMEQLFQLGIGLKMVRCLVPRIAWHSIPGGLPYYAVKLDGFV
jgi:hypothetical protein